MANSIFIANPQLFPAGTGGALVKIGGQLTFSTTQLGNTATTSAEDLWSYTMPANTLITNGDRLEVEIYGTFGATGNNKTLYAVFNGTNLNASTTTQNGGSWRMAFTVQRRSSTVALTMGDRVDAGTQRGWVLATVTTDWTGAIIIKMQGQSQTTGAANDVVFEGASVTYFPAAA